MHTPVLRGINSKILNQLIFFLSGKCRSTRNLLESSSFYYIASHFKSLKVPSSSTMSMAVLEKSPCSFTHIKFNSPFQSVRLPVLINYHAESTNLGVNRAQIIWNKSSPEI